MKYYIIAAVIVCLGLVAVLLSQGDRTQTIAVADWKRVAIEPETKIRPDSFEDMKWRASESVELRSPASQKKDRK